MTAQRKPVDGCVFAALWIIAVPTGVVLLVDGRGDWIIGAVVAVAIGVMLLVTVGELLSGVGSRRASRRRRDS